MIDTNVFLNCVNEMGESHLQTPTISVLGHKVSMYLSKILRKFVMVLKIVVHNRLFGIIDQL